MKRILVVEDEARIAMFVEKGLRSAGYTPTVVGDGLLGVDYATTGEFDLVLLDIGLPALDGFGALKRIHQADPALPVIMLTARDSSSDTVAALDAGAHDYITKPFKFDELLARIRRRLRDDAGSGGLDRLLVGGIGLDLRTRRAQVDGAEIELSTREFALAEMFLRHPDQVLSREQLLSHVWGYDFDPGSNVVDVYVGYLRRKLGSQRFATVRGAGYRFVGG